MALPRYQYIYGYSLFNDLHNFLPELLYDAEMFPSRTFDFVRYRMSFLFPEDFSYQQHSYRLYSAATRRSAYQQAQQAQMAYRAHFVNAATAATAATAEPDAPVVTIVSATAVATATAATVTPVPVDARVNLVLYDEAHYNHGGDMDTMMRSTIQTTMTSSGPASAPMGPSGPPAPTGLSSPPAPLGPSGPAAPLFRTPARPPRPINTSSPAMLRAMLNTPVRMRGNRVVLEEDGANDAMVSALLGLLGHGQGQGNGLGQFLGNNQNNLVFEDVPVVPTNQQIDDASTLLVPVEVPPETICSVCQHHYYDVENDITQVDIRTGVDWMWRRLHCNHSCHRPCIDQWFTQSVLCPICRADVRITTRETPSPSPESP
jgi:hypothetical protein